MKNVIALITFIGLLGLGLIYMIPEYWTVQRSLEIKSDAAKIYPYLVNLQRWNEWTSLNTKPTEDVTITFSGPESGVGAIQTWHNKSYDTKGSLQITEAIADKSIQYMITMGQDSHEMKAQVQLQPLEQATRIVWSAEGHSGYNPKNRFFSLFLDKFIGNDFELGLQQLKQKVESTP